MRVKDTHHTADLRRRIYAAAARAGFTEADFRTATAWYGIEVSISATIDDFVLGMARASMSLAASFQRIGRAIRDTGPLVYGLRPSELALAQGFTLYRDGYATPDEEPVDHAAAYGGYEFIHRMGIAGEDLRPGDVVAWSPSDGPDQVVKKC